MVIDKVHGLRATSMSLNDRFTLLAAAPPRPASAARRRRPSGLYLNLNQLQQIALRLEMQAQRQNMRRRVGFTGGLRRFGSEGNLPALARANNFQGFNSGIKSRIAWRQSIGNLSGMALRRRGGARLGLRGRLRGRIPAGRVPRIGNTRRGAKGGGGRGRAGRGRGKGAGRGQGAGPARGAGPSRGATPSREQLDAQLDQYMAGSRAALDRQLDEYMSSAAMQE